MALCILIALSCIGAPKVHPVREGPALVEIAPDAALRKELTKYGLRAYRFGDDDLACQCLVYSPSSHLRGKCPLVVYLPGAGERGDVVRQFRQRTVIDRVCSSGFQKRHPCYLLAISPPESARTLVGGMPGAPNPVQTRLHALIRAILTNEHSPAIDPSRIYLTGFSYGGDGVYSLACHYPDEFAASVPVSSLPPLPEYFCAAHPGSWWHFHNEGDYARHDIEVSDVAAFSAQVNAAGGEFRIGTYPASGHDAWTAAWREDAVWEWMFSKSLDVHRKGPSVVTSLPPSAVKCSASVRGADGCEPERAADGLDETFYAPFEPIPKGGWWMVEYDRPVSGRVSVVTGDRKGEGLLSQGYVEVSSNGRSWTRAGTLSSKTGMCSFVRTSKFRFLRIVVSGPRPQMFRLRRVEVGS